MHFSHVLSILTVCVLAFADPNEESNTDNNKEYPLEEEKYSTEENIPRKYNLTQILTISNSLQYHLYILEELYHYLPPARAFFTARSGSTTKTIQGFSEHLRQTFIINPMQSIRDELRGIKTKSKKPRTVKCKNVLHLDNGVQMVNSRQLCDILRSDSNITRDDTPGDCIVVLFYSKECPFSLVAAPHFKLLAHLFPQINMVAINSINEQWLNFKYEIIGIPTVILFHNGNFIAKHQITDNTFFGFTKFLIFYTDLVPGDINPIYLNELLNAVNRVPKKVYKPDYALWLAWFVIIFWMLYYAITKDLWTRFIEEIQNNLYGDEEGVH